MNYGLRWNALLSVLFLLGSSFSAYAIQSVNVQTYNPSTSTKFVLLEDALRTEWPKSPKFFFGINYNYVQDPLVATDLARVGQVSSIISSINTVDTYLGYKPDKQLGLYIALPVHSVAYMPGNPLGVSGTNTVAGDLKLLGKVRLNQDDGNTDVAVIPEFHLPTGNTENFVSDASTYIALKFAIERAFEKFTLSVNGGFGLANNATYETIDMRKRILLGVGGFIPFSDVIAGSVEFLAQIPVPFNNYLNPNEIYGGLHFKASENFALTAGGSMGKMSGSTGQNFRFIAGLRYTIPDDTVQEMPRPVYTPPPAAPVVQAAPIAPAPTPWPSPAKVQAPAQKPLPVPTAAPIAVPTAAPAIPSAEQAKATSAMPAQTPVKKAVIKKTTVKKKTR